MPNTRTGGTGVGASDGQRARPPVEKDSCNCRRVFPRWCEALRRGQHLSSSLHGCFTLPHVIGVLTQHEIQNFSRSRGRLPS